MLDAKKKRGMNKQAGESLGEKACACGREKQNMWWNQGCEELMSPAKSV